MLQLSGVVIVFLVPLAPVSNSDKPWSLVLSCVCTGLRITFIASVNNVINIILSLAVKQFVKAHWVMIFVGSYLRCIVCSVLILEEVLKDNTSRLDLELSSYIGLNSSVMKPETFDNTRQQRLLSLYVLANIVWEITNAILKIEILIRVLI